MTDRTWDDRLRDYIDGLPEWAWVATLTLTLISIFAALAAFLFFLGVS